MFRMTAMDLRPGATDYLLSQMGCGDELDARERELAQAAERGDAVAYYTAAHEHGESPGRWRGRGAALLGLAEGSEVSEDGVKSVLGGLQNPETGEQLGSRPPRYETRESRFAQALSEAGENVTAERRRELWNEVTDSAKSATGFYDLTFSAQKSVSVYWSALKADGQQHLADAVQRAHRDAVGAAMDYLEREATWTRVGKHTRVPGGRTTGEFEQADRLVAVEFDHSTSRAEDPHLHTHTAVANRVPCKDGHWRAIHGAAWNKAKAHVAAIYERTLAERIEETTPARFVVREDGMGREIAGISAEALEASSQRTREVEQEQSAAIAEFRETYGRAPYPRERQRIHRQAGLSSRSAKTGHSPDEQLAGWAERVDSEAITREAAAAGRDIDQYGRPDADALPDPLDRDAVARSALHEVQARAATFTHGELVAEIERQIGMRPEGIADVTAYAQEIGDEVTASSRYDVLSIARPEPAPVPDWWRDDTGRPVWADPAAGRYTTRAQMSTERDLVVTARQHTHRALTAPELRDVHAKLVERGLNEGQRDAVLGILGSPRAADAMVSGAGTGKSFTVGQLREQWESRTGGRVLGLATSQRATQVLEADGLQALNTTVFLHSYEPDPETGRPRERLGHRDLLVVDESNMSSTAELARIQRIAQHSGAKLLYTGDPEQLQAVGAGGALGHIARENGCFELTEVRRFEQDWEKDASLQLRAGNVDVVDLYQEHGRLRGGTAEEMRDQAVRGYLADTAKGYESLLITATNGEAADVGAITQTERGRLGQLGEQLPLTLGDGNSVHVGDLLQARKNDHSIAVDGQLVQVTNRERYTVVSGDSEKLLAERIDGAGRAWLPADYLAEHATLGYAGTAHAAEGMTVDTGHALHPAYVPMTRGRVSNTAYLTTQAPGDEHGPGLDQTPRQVFAAALSRDATEQTAVEQYRSELAAAEHTASHLSVWDHVNRELADYRHGDALVGALGVDAADRIEMEDGKDGLYESLRRAELHGHDVNQLLEQVATERSLARVDDLASVLRYRVDQHLGPRAQTTTWTERTVDIPGPLGEFQKEVAALADSRQRELGRQAAEAQPEWAVQMLGAVPEAEEQRTEWETRAGRIAAYREFQMMPEDRLTLGSRPHDQLAQLSYDTAAEAAGLDQTALDYNTADEATLQAWVQRSDRAAAWAPEYVRDELGQAREVTARRSSELTLLHQRAAVAEGDEAERLEQEVERSQQLLDRLREREQVLVDLHTARNEWLANTAGVRERGEEARQELARREPPASEHQQDQQTQGQLITPDELMPQLSTEQLADVTRVADRNATQEATQRHEQHLTADHGRDHSQGQQPQTQDADAEPDVSAEQEIAAGEQAGLFTTKEAAAGNERVAAEGEALQVDPGTLESSRGVVSPAASAVSVHQAQIKARYAAEMLGRHQGEDVEDEQAQHAREANQAAERAADAGHQQEQHQHAQLSR